MSSNFDWKRVFKIILRIFIIIIIILSVTVVSLAGTFFFYRWKADVSEKASGDKNFLESLLTSDKKELKPTVTCLFLGVNGNLTDFIMLGQYDPNTREIDLVSVPRDTNVGNASVDGKINSVYSSRSLDKLKDEITRITGIDINYYVLFKTKVLREIVDEIGGVRVNVPINMNYDDPYQNLHIHLNKGEQLLDGSKAEQFCRFRKNNNGTGYPGGDVERTKTQQQFVKAFINELLKGENISKLGSLINIVVENTKTDITTDIAKSYIGDAIALRTDRIYTNTLPGTARMGHSQLGYNTSYYYLDYEAVQEMIDEMFYNKTKSSGDDEKAVETFSNSVSSSKDEITSKSLPTAKSETISKSIFVSKNEVTSKSVSTQKNIKDNIRIEILNAGTTLETLNNLVNKLKADNLSVVKIGNYETTKIETSRIIDYGTGSDTTLKKIKEVCDLSKTEDVPGTSSVDYTIILGPNYK